MRPLILGCFMAFFQNVAIQPDGKIVAAGVSRLGNEANFALARYTSGIVGTVALTAPVIRASVSPNPAHTSAQINWPSPETMEWGVQIFDRFGTLVFTKATQKTVVVLERNNLPAGMYFFKASAINGATCAAKLLFVD